MAECPPGYYDCECGGCGPPCDQCYDQLGCADPSAQNYNRGYTENYHCLDCSDTVNIQPEY